MSSGTMGRLYVGVSGLQTSQYALNTTAHNLMNTQTDGYTRQQVMLTDRTYNNLGQGPVYPSKVGLGVVTAEMRQVRDNFADIEYRMENGRMDYYKAQYETVSEVVAYFGELEGKDFNKTIDDFWTSLQEVQKETNSLVTRSSLVATAHYFLDRIQTIRSSMITYQRKLNENIQMQVGRINDLADTVMEMNEAILSAEASGIENANDYRDIRNSALDELSGLVNIECVNNIDGTVEVFAEGRLLVTKGRTYELEAVRIKDNKAYSDRYDFTEDSTDFMMPVWKDDQVALFNIERQPSTKNNSDVGSLKGLMMSRGYFVSDYTNVPVQPKKPLAADYDTDAQYQAAVTKYEADYSQYANDLDYYQKYVEPYTITNLMAQFDVLVHAMMTQINDVLCPNKEVTLADGTTIKVLDEEKAGIGMGKGNEYPGTELFIRRTVPRYTEQTVTLADGTTQTLQVYNEEDRDNFYSLYTSGNVEINQELLSNPSLLPLSRNVGEEAQDVADELLDLWNRKFATVSPDSMVECNYVDYYAGMMDDLADRGYTFNGLAQTEEQAITDIENQRQQVVGVSSDEELSNLIRFQHAYNASSRYMNTVSEMIEHIINTLGA